MSLKHYLPVFCLVGFAIVLILTFKINSLTVLDQRTSQFNETIDTAVDDTLNSMLAVTDSFAHDVNLQVCSNKFFRALNAGFDLSDSKTGSKQLSMYVPILLLTDTDGFYVCYHSLSPDKQYTAKVWTQKMPYFYSSTVEDSGANSPTSYKYTIDFTMSDLIHLTFTKFEGGVSDKSYSFDGNFNTIVQENAGAEGLDELQAVWTLLREEKQPLSDSNFKRFKQSVMIYQITKKANYYVNKHNKIAQAYGISYHFSLPESSTDSFTRTIEDVSLMAIFQGYPYGKGTDDVYSRFSVSGARIYRGGRFYVMPASDGVSYYHRSDCPELEGSRSNYQAFDSKKQCAEFGAYPCPKCKP